MRLQYVDGGLYINHTDVCAIVDGIIGVVSNAGDYAWLVAAKIVGVLSWIAAIPVVGWIFLGWLGANAGIVAAGFIAAYVTDPFDITGRGKGVDFSYSWFTVKFQVK
jgi:hypothetical protein